MEDVPTRVVVAGVGRFGTLHVRAWTEAGARVVGVVDADPGRAREVAAAYAVPEHGEDLRRMVASARPDVVVVASDEASHSDLTDIALEAGCHVFVEKPFALAVERAVRTRDLAARAGRSVVVGHISRFAAPYRYMRQALEAGRLGELWAMRLRRDFSRAWFLGFGDRVHPVWESCIHDIDLAVYFAGTRAARVVAMQSRAAGPAAPSVVSALVEFASGVTATIESAWTVPASAPDTLVGALALDGAIVGEAELLGSAGTLRQRLVNDALTEWGPGGSVAPDLSLWPEIDGRLGGALATEVAYALDVFAGRRPNTLMPESEAVWGVEIAEAIVASLGSGAPVVLAGRAAVP
ncbi:Gfo/Idh/MocA family protein [Georgenia sp. AZ-5]|uniref:Gfo/Idh/MocA family protein n=1 Tax=Georgenia sp. AZ-5 TaxID=3367526 RepID=UPI003754C227